MTMGSIQGLPRPEEKYDERTIRSLVTALQKVSFRTDDFLATGTNIISTTSNAPVDTEIKFSMPEGQAVLVRLNTIAADNNASYAVAAFQWAAFQRPVLGNIAIVGSVQGTPQESGVGSPTVTMVPNTTNQTIVIRDTGENGVTYTWRHVWEILSLK